MRTRGAAGNFHLPLLLYICTSSVWSFSLLVFELFFQRLTAMLAKALRALELEQSRDNDKAILQTSAEC
jgi:hypothetical protein